MDNTFPPPIVVPLYTIARDKSKRNIRPSHKWGKAYLGVYTLSLVEGVEPSEKPSTKAFCSVDSIQEVILPYLVIVNLFCVFVARVDNLSKFWEHEIILLSSAWIYLS